MVSNWVAVLVAVLAVTSLQGQTQLQFSQALSLELTGVLVGNSNDAVAQTLNIVVPAGRVWKIESVHHSAMRNTGGGDVPVLGQTMITLNGVLLVPKTGNSHAGIVMSPMWLPPGTYTLELWQDSDAAIVQVKAIVSVLEFYNL